MHGLNLAYEQDPVISRKWCSSSSDFLWIQSNWLAVLVVHLVILLLDNFHDSQTNVIFRKSWEEQESIWEDYSHWERILWNGITSKGGAWIMHGNCGEWGGSSAIGKCRLELVKCSISKNSLCGNVPGDMQHSNQSKFACERGIWMKI